MHFDYTRWQGPNPGDMERMRQLMDIYRNLLLQTGGMVALHNDEPQPAQALVVTIQDLEADRMGAASGISSASETFPTASRAR